MKNTLSVTEINQLKEEKVGLEKEVIYFSKRSIALEKMLKEVAPFCPCIQRNEIRELLEEVV